MAKISPIHGEMSGSIAGNTWSHNKGGQYVRQRRTPTNPNTVRQQSARTNLGSSSTSWSGLVQANRDAWDVWAAANPRPNTLGIATVLSGHQAYNGFSTLLRDSAGTPSATPPAGTGPVGLSSLSIAYSAGNFTLTFGTSPLGAGKRLIIRWTGWLSPGRNPNWNQSRNLTYSAANPTTGLVVAAPTAAVAGQATNLFVAVMDAAGQTSAYLKVRVQA